jgi:hypothetical protein
MPDAIPSIAFHVDTTCAEDQRPPASHGAGRFEGLDLRLNADRRLLPRHLTPGRIVRIDALGHSGLCAVRNLSDAGAMIETAIDCSLGSAVRIGFDCTNGVQGRIVWRDGNRAGIRFLIPIASVAFIRKVANDRWTGISRPPRLSANAAAQATSGSNSFTTIISNVSQRGLGITHKGQLAIGMPVEVATTDGVRLRGSVRWSDGKFAGIELCGGLSAEQLLGARRF